MWHPPLDSGKEDGLSTGDDLGAHVIMVARSRAPDRPRPGSPSTLLVPGSSAQRSELRPPPVRKCSKARVPKWQPERSRQSDASLPYWNAAHWKRAKDLFLIQTLPAASSSHQDFTATTNFFQAFLSS